MTVHSREVLQTRSERVSSLDALPSLYVPQSCCLLLWVRGFSPAWNTPTPPAPLFVWLTCYHHVLREAFPITKTGSLWSPFIALILCVVMCLLAHLPSAFPGPVSFPASAQAKGVNRYLTWLLFQASVTCLLQRRGFIWLGPSFPKYPPPIPHKQILPWW